MSELPGKNKQENRMMTLKQFRAEVARLKAAEAQAGGVDLQDVNPEDLERIDLIMYEAYKRESPGIDEDAFKREKAQLLLIYKANTLKHGNPSQKLFMSYLINKMAADVTRLMD